MTTPTVVQPAFSIKGEFTIELPKGENSPQSPAGLYAMNGEDPLALHRFQLISGAPPSYVNYTDLDRLLQTMTHLAMGFLEHDEEVPYIALGAKHGNCCGAAFGPGAIAVFRNMVRGDPGALFGGAVMTNFSLDEGVLTEELLPPNLPVKKLLLDVVAAPSFTDEFMSTVERKHGKCRFLANPALLHLHSRCMDVRPRFRYVRGGFLLQPNYFYVPFLNANNTDLKIIGEPLDQQGINDFLLAWSVGATSNSNTITLVRDGMLIGNAVGQQDRVGACRLAIARASNTGHRTKNAVAYSDSFFPFPDGPKLLADWGVRAIFTTSGSVRDQEVIDLCRERGVTLYLLPDAEARGFYGH